MIGIGAGADVDGQVLVIHDLVGLTNEFNPRFLRRYMNLYEDMKKAIEAGDWKTAAVEGRDSRWHKQVTNRAERLMVSLEEI